MLEVSRIFAQKVFSYTVRQDRNVIHHVFGLDQPFRAVRRPRTQEELIVRPEQIDGFDLDGCARESMKVENRLLVFEDLCLVHNERACAQRLQKLTPVHTLEILRRSNADAPLFSVIAESSRAPKAANAGVAPFHRSCSTSSKSAISVRSVASVRN